MNREPFSRSDLQFTLGVITLIVVSLVYVRLEYDKAFPQASIQLHLSKGEITTRAAAFAAQRGVRTEGYRELTVFDPDDDARLYLERELGLQRANQLMQRDVSIWRWRARWFRPPEQEETTVLASPDGRIVGFEHIIPETAAGARLDHDRALRLAQDFLHGISSAPAHMVEDRLEQKPNRYDFVFTWEQDGFRAKQATYRRTVLIQGDRIGRYSEFLYVPESWRRDFAGMRARNDLYALIAEACWLPLVLAALGLVVRGLRRKEIPWRPLIAISGVVGILGLLSQLNSIPLLVDRFPTSSPYPQTLLLIVLQSLGVGVGIFFYIIIAGAAGEPIYRRRFADPLSLRTVFSRRGMATRRFYRGVLAGYGFAAVHVAFLVAFYLIGRRFGVWSPQDVEYSDLLSTALPWIYPVAIASMAGASEEFWFRLLAVPLLDRLLRRRWLAVILPAFVWGFLHANYPQQPAWIRGVEVGLIGVGAGFLMLRFGILATLIWHYTVDAVLIGSFLFSAHTLSFRLNAAVLAIAVAAPLIVAVVLYRRHRGFLALEAEAPAAVEAPSEPELPERRVGELRPAWRVRWLYAGAAAAGLIGIVLSPHIFGNWIRVRLDRPAAEAIARRAVPDPQRWRQVTDLVSNLDPAEFEYLRRVAGVDAAERIVRERKATAVWRTRFWRPLEKEEWRVYVDQNGSVVRCDHILDERAPGDRLGPEQARQRAESALPAKGLTLVDSSEERREKRTDWSFVFEDPQFRAGAARARTSVELHGSEISNRRRFLKLPEEWLREFQKPSLRSFVVPALIGAIAFPLLILLLRRLGSHETVFHWRIYALLGIATALVSCVSNVNQFATAWMGYDTAMPEQNYLTQYLIGRVVVVVAASAGIFAMVLAVDVFRQAAVGQAALNTPSVPRAAAVAVLLAGTSRAISGLLDRVPGPRANLPVWNGDMLDNWLPGLSPLVSGYMAGVVSVCGVGLLVFAAMRYMGDRRRILSAAVVIAAIALSRSLTLLQFGAHALAAAVWLAVLVLLVRTLAADLTGIGVALFWMAALSGSYQLVEQPAPFLRWNGVAAAFVAVLVGMVLISVLRVLQPRQSAARQAR